MRCAREVGHPAQFVTVQEPLNARRQDRARVVRGQLAATLDPLPCVRVVEPKEAQLARHRPRRAERRGQLVEGQQVGLDPARDIDELGIRLRGHGLFRLAVVEGARDRVRPRVHCAPECDLHVGRGRLECGSRRGGQQLVLLRGAAEVRRRHLCVQPVTYDVRALRLVCCIGWCDRRTQSRRQCHCNAPRCEPRARRQRRH